MCEKPIDRGEPYFEKTSLIHCSDSAAKRDEVVLQRTEAMLEAMGRILHG